MPHMKEPSHIKSPTKLKTSERPKVSFGPYVEKHRPVPGKQKDFANQTRHVAKGHFTPNPGKSLISALNKIPYQKLHIHKCQISLSWYCFNIFSDPSHHNCCSFINIRPPSPRRPGLNLSDPSNPILHPPRLTYSNFNKKEGGSSLPQQAEKKKRVIIEFSLFTN